MTDEFTLIAKYFAPLSAAIGDDCAILDLAPGERLAISVDTMVEGVHFQIDSPPDQVAYRAVVTALSDLAAAGAEPRAITLALTLPAGDESWVQQFSRGLHKVMEAYGVTLLGGDTTCGPLTVTVQVMGAVPADSALSRAGARPGDLVYVSGTPGDAAAGLAVMKGEWPGPGLYKEYLLKRFYQPAIHFDLARQLRDIASSAIDVSDGVLADAGHICERSGVGIRIEPDRMPLSQALQAVTDQHLAREWALTGGDDYELLFTVPADRAADVPTTCTRIGEVIEGSAVQCDFAFRRAGYAHFNDTPSDPTAGATQPPSDPAGSEGRSTPQSQAGATQPPSDPMGSEGESAAPPNPPSDPAGSEGSYTPESQAGATQPPSDPMGSEGRSTPGSEGRSPAKPNFKSIPQFLAFGFGAGLSPKAPGTAGTIVAVPLYLLASQLSLPVYSALLVLATLAGIWLCGRASRELGVHDHPGIVWDEFVGYWITMWALPTSWVTVLAGFALFRLFDIAKPWPISHVDKHVSGGWGIMVDDILAGIASCAVLHGLLYFGVIS